MRSVFKFFYICNGLLSVTFLSSCLLENTVGTPYRGERAPTVYQTPTGPQGGTETDRYKVDYLSVKKTANGFNKGFDSNSDDLQFANIIGSSQYQDPNSEETSTDEANGYYCYDNELNCKHAPQEIRNEAGSKPTFISQFQVKLTTTGYTSGTGGAVLNFIKVRGWSFITAKMSINTQSGVGEFSHIKKLGEGDCTAGTTVDLSLAPTVTTDLPSVPVSDLGLTKYRHTGFDTCGFVPGLNGGGSGTCSNANVEALTGLSLIEEGTNQSVAPTAGSYVRQFIEGTLNAGKIWPLAIRASIDDAGLFQFDWMGSRSSTLTSSFGKYDFEDPGSGHDYGIGLPSNPIGYIPGDEAEDDPDRVIVGFCINAYKVANFVSPAKEYFCNNPEKFGFPNQICPSELIGQTGTVAFKKYAKPLFWKGLFKTYRPVITRY